MPDDNSTTDHGAVQGTDQCQQNVTEAIKSLTKEIRAIRLLLEKQDKARNAQHVADKFGSQIRPKGIL
jgi:hypothetical protein